MSRPIRCTTFWQSRRQAQRRLRLQDPREVAFEHILSRPMVCNALRHPSQRAWSLDVSASAGARKINYHLVIIRVVVNRRPPLGVWQAVSAISARKPTVLEGYTIRALEPPQLSTLQRTLSLFLICWQFWGIPVLPRQTLSSNFHTTHAALP